MIVEEKSPARTAGKALKALDKQDRKCDICGATFVGSGKAKYCPKPARCKYIARRIREANA